MSKAPPVTAGVFYWMQAKDCDSVAFSLAQQKTRRFETAG